MKAEFQAVPLKGSEQKLVHGRKFAVAQREDVRVTVHMEDGADPEDYRLVEEFAQTHDLSVLSSSPERQTVALAGTIGALEEAFGTCLEHVQTGKGLQFRVRSGPLTIPASWQGKVIAVLGLDNRQVAWPKFRLRPKNFVYPHDNTRVTSLPVSYVHDGYQFPKNATGKGATVAIVELGGGYAMSDITEFLAQFNIETPSITDVPVLGAANAPGNDADMEVVLDLEIASATAPGAKYQMYFAPNTDQGFCEALLDILTSADKPDIVSISWGGPEDSWTGMAKGAMRSALYRLSRAGVSVFVAAGDNLSTDGESDGQEHVDFPASCEFVTACGGTRLVLNSDFTIHAETVWNDDGSGTGGGVSTGFALPDYQKTAGVPKASSGFVGRGVPDVAGNADPATGFQVLLNDSPQVVGGTSAVAPLYAGLAALIHELRGGKRVGLYNSHLYRTASAVFNDITKGNNDVGGEGFKAGKGWDATTGLGSINGTKLAEVLANQAGTKAPAKNNTKESTNVSEETEPVIKPNDGPIPDPPPPPPKHGDVAKPNDGPIPDPPPPPPKKGD